MEITEAEIEIITRQIVKIIINHQLSLLPLPLSSS